ncbi:MAG: hypothetical protein H6597_06350 [Flavobacteriales bacterium]|nr:hypothetical protein [Flavobacteriales bacterium]MCB9194136.1 hypothetical protein [Flavobacteriales bacterium]
MSHLRTIAIGAILLVLTSWHLEHGPNDNTMSRAAMVAAVIEQHSLCIDAYQEGIGDKAFMDGHYYSDKAPLPALLVIPFYQMMVWTGVVHAGERGLLTDGLLMLGGFICGSMPLVLIMLLSWNALRRSTPPAAPILFAVLPFLGSFLFVYSGSFNAHILGALFVILGSISMEREHYAWMGLACGAAVLCEYTLIVFPLVWGAMVLARLRDEPPGPPLRALIGIMKGASPMVLLLLFFNYAQSGNPLSLGYDHEAHYTFMSNGYGLGLPTWTSLWGLTFSSYRGLFIYMPVLVAVAAAWALSPRKGIAPWNDAVLIACILSLLIVAGYRMWWGGWAYGPRHLTTVAVLLAYRGLPLLATQRWGRWPFFVLAGIGILEALAAKSTLGYSMPTGVLHPLSELVLPELRAGHFTIMQWPCALGLTPAQATTAFVIVLILAIFALGRLDPGGSRH